MSALERLSAREIEIRNEILELVNLFDNLKAERTGRRPRACRSMEDSAGWESFRRLRNMLYAYECWDDRRIYLEAQFKYLPEKVDAPWLTAIYGPKAYSKYMVHRRKKRLIEMSLERAQESKFETIQGPYKESFEWSAYNLRLYINAGMPKLDLYKYMDSLFSGYFIASDPEAWSMLREDPFTFGKNVQECYEALDSDRTLQRELRDLWRSSCRAQQLGTT